MGIFSRLFGRTNTPEPEHSVPEDDSAVDTDADTRGWDAISAVFDAAYPGQEPQHWGTLIPFSMGGPDPLTGVSAYRATSPVPHWHYVTYGYSDLFGEGPAEAEESGYGVEMTLCLADPAAADPEASAPVWVVNMLQNLARYVFRSGNVIRAGHYLDANGPIATEEDTQLTALAFQEDPLHPEPLSTPNGTVRFVQAVGITAAELEAVSASTARGILEIIAARHGVGLTDLTRPGTETDPQAWAQVQALVAEGGTGTKSFFVETLRATLDGEDLVIDLKGAHHALFTSLAASLTRGDGDKTFLEGRDLAVVIGSGQTQGWRIEDDVVTLTLTAADGAILAGLPSGPGSYRMSADPGVVWQISPADPT